MNAAAELENKDFATVAAGFLSQTSGLRQCGGVEREGRRLQTISGASSSAPISGASRSSSWDSYFSRSRPASSSAFRSGFSPRSVRRCEGWIIGATGVVQTIPSLALLAVLIPLTGRIGAVPAYIALALYALLPIVRNTHAALTQISRGMIQAAQSLGMRPGTILEKIELPLAATTILAGIKTSAVINVGTATIAAFIGAGGFGERIVTGLALNDHAMLLAGAIPAAVMALLIELGFRYAERWLLPAGLRRAPNVRPAAT